MRESSLRHSTTKGPPHSGEIPSRMGRARVTPSCRHPKGVAPAAHPVKVDHDASPLPPRPSAVGKPEGSVIRNLKNAGFKIKTTAQTRTCGQYGVVLSQSGPGGTRAKPKPSFAS
jgi:hypothetical protein